MVQRRCIGIFISLCVVLLPWIVMSEHLDIYSEIDTRAYHKAQHRAAAVYITTAENTSYEYKANTENNTMAEIWMKLVCEKYNPMEAVVVEPEADTGGWEHTLVPDTIEITENGQSEHPFVLILTVPPLKENTTKEITFSGAHVALGGIMYTLPEIAADFTFFINETSEVGGVSQNEETENSGFPTGVVIGITAIVLIMVLISIVIIRRRKIKE